MTSGMLAFGFYNVTCSIQFWLLFFPLVSFFFFFFSGFFERWWPPRLKTHITLNVGET